MDEAMGRESSAVGVIHSACRGSNSEFLHDCESHLLLGISRQRLVYGVCPQRWWRVCSSLSQSRSSGDGRGFGSGERPANPLSLVGANRERTMENGETA